MSAMLLEELNPELRQILDIELHLGNKVIRSEKMDGKSILYLENKIHAEEATAEVDGYIKKYWVYSISAENAVGRGYEDSKTGDKIVYLNPKKPEELMSSAIRKIYDLEISLGNKLQSTSEDDAFYKAPFHFKMHLPLHHDKIKENVDTTLFECLHVEGDRFSGGEVGFRCKETYQVITSYK